MGLKKDKSSQKPLKVKVLGAADSTHRSGNILKVTALICWKPTFDNKANLWTYYSSAETFFYDKTKPFSALQAAFAARYDALNASDTSGADQTGQILGYEEAFP